MRELRVCSSVHPFTTTNKTPMIQAVQAAELSAEKPSTQGEMNNQTPRMRAIPSAIVAVLIEASAQSARITPITPTIQTSPELDPFVDVLKTQGEMKRRTPNTREVQSCQRVHAFIVTISCNPLQLAGLHRNACWRVLSWPLVVLVNCAHSNNRLAEYSVRPLQQNIFIPYSHSCATPLMGKKGNTVKIKRSLIGPRTPTRGPPRSHTTPVPTILRRRFCSSFGASSYLNGIVAGPTRRLLRHRLRLLPLRLGEG